MNKVVGLTSGIGVDIQSYRDSFLDMGFELFNINHVEFALRSGNLSSIVSSFDKYGLTNDLTELSKLVRHSLHVQFPSLYDSKGFNRMVLLSLLNDPLSGSENYNSYSNIISPYTKELLFSWIGVVPKDKLISSCLLVERDYLNLLDELNVVVAPTNEQVGAVFEKNHAKVSSFTLDDAKKAVNRQYSCEKKYVLAKEILGADVVFRHNV